MIRRSSTDAIERIEHISDRIELVQGDLLDQASLDRGASQTSSPTRSTTWPRRASCRPPGTSRS